MGISDFQLKFIKKRFESIEAAKTASLTGEGEKVGRVVFDEASKTIWVNGEIYGSKVANVDYDSNTGKLTIIYGDGSNKILNFHNLETAGYGAPNAQGLAIPVFAQLQGAIGIQGNASFNDYSDTRYIQGDGTHAHDMSLREADKVLDQTISGVDDKIAAMQGHAVIATQTGHVVTIHPWVQGQQGWVQGSESNTPGAIILDDVAITGEAKDVHYDKQGDNPEQEWRPIYMWQQRAGEERETTSTSQSNTRDGWSSAGATDEQFIISTKEVKFEGQEPQTIKSLYDSGKIDKTDIPTGTGYWRLITIEYGVTKDDVQDAITELDKNIFKALEEAKSGAAKYDIIKQQDADDGYTATYQLRQTLGDGTVTLVGEKINIPKDWLLKNAELGTVIQTDLDPNGKFYDVTSPGDTQHEHPSYQEGGIWKNINWAVGDKYFDFTLNVKNDSDENPSTQGDSYNTGEKHLYLNVNDLYDSYIGDSANVIDYTGTTFTNREGAVNINIDQTNNRISATINNKAVTALKLSNNIITIPSTTPEVKNDGREVTVATFKTNDGNDQVQQHNINVKMGIYWDVWDDSPAES